MPTTHIKHCKKPHFDTIYYFESFYYDFNGKNMVSVGKNCNFKL